MKDTLASILFVFMGGALWMLLARFNYYTQNPQNIHRHENGNVHWRWMLFVNITAIVTGGAVSTVAFMVIKYTGLLNDEFAVFVSSMFGIAADKIFLVLQQQMYNKAEKYIDDEF
jgi:hypothetical protein